MTQANLIGISILFQMKSHKIEGVETKIVGLSLISRGMEPGFKQQLLYNIQLYATA